MGAALALAPLAFHPSPAPAADLGAAYAPWGFDLSGRNTTIAPGDDFFGYADGAAVQRIAIPADRTAWGSFAILAELSRSRVQDILQSLSAHPVADPQTAEQKLGAFYAAFMDDRTVEARGVQPLQPDLAAIRAVTDRTRFAALLGAAQDGYQTSLFALSVAPDARDPPARRSSSARAAPACPTATTTCAPPSPTRRRPTGPTSRRC